MTESNKKSKVPFKNENLPRFCFGCGKLGHNLRDCKVVSPRIKELSEYDYPFSIALKAELNFVGKISLSLGLNRKKKMEQCSYLGIDDRSRRWPKNLRRL